MAFIESAAAVTAANSAFYEAFERKDLDAMSDLWERSDRSVCTHPGWTTLRGWAPIAASFFAIFSGRQQLQFVLTEQRVEVAGEVAWVSVDENILGEDGGGATVAALNVFVNSGDRWRMVCHHGSVVSQSTPT